MILPIKSVAWLEVSFSFMLINFQLHPFSVMNIPTAGKKAFTILSLASAYGSSQLKHQKVGGCKKEVLEWFKYLMQAPNPNTKLAAMTSTCIITSLMFHWGQPDSGESCTVLESRPARRLVTKFHDVQYRNLLLQVKNTANEVKPLTGMCKTLLPDISTWRATDWSQLCTWAHLTYFWSTKQEFRFSMVDVTWRM